MVVPRPGTAEKSEWEIVVACSPCATFRVRWEPHAKYHGLPRGAFVARGSAGKALW